MVLLSTQIDGYAKKHQFYVQKSAYLDIWLNSFPASSNFFYLLITFANSLDPDQDWQNVGPGPEVIKLFSYLT